MVVSGLTPFVAVPAEWFQNRYVLYVLISELLRRGCHQLL